MTVSSVEIADKFSGPVALIAGFLSRTKIFDGGRDRPWEFIEQRRINLVSARKLGAHKPGGTRADVTLCAGDARVRPLQVGSQFRLHYRVAGLAAKLNRLRELIGFVAPHSGNQQEA